MAKVFLDIGAHVGETLAVVMRPEWGFDRIVCFEPAPDCWSALEELADARVEICKFGLWTSDSTMQLYDPGSVGASLFASKSTTGHSTEVILREASLWFDSNLSPADEVVMKVNCEGAECKLLMHLLDHGSLQGMAEILVHFDVRKVPDLAHEEATTRAALKRSTISFRSADEIFFGRNITEKTTNWLRWYEAPRWRQPIYSHLRRWEFAVRIAVFKRRNRGTVVEH